MPHMASIFLFVLAVVTVVFLLSDSLPALRGLLIFVAGAFTLLGIAFYISGQAQPDPLVLAKRQIGPVAHKEAVAEETPVQVHIEAPKPRPVVVVTKPIPRPVASAPAFVRATPPASVQLLEPSKEVPTTDEAEAAADPYEHPVDEPLTAEEKRDYLVALGKASRVKAPGSEAERQALRMEYINIRNQYKRAEAAGISQMRANESARGAAMQASKTWAEAEFYRRVYSQNIVNVQNGIEATRAMRLQNNQVIARQSRQQAAADACYRARALQDVHEQFGQYTKAALARKVAENACR